MEFALRMVAIRRRELKKLVNAETQGRRGRRGICWRELMDAVDLVNLMDVVDLRGAAGFRRSR